MLIAFSAGILGMGMDMGMDTATATIHMKRRIEKGEVCSGRLPMLAKLTSDRRKTVIACYNTCTTQSAMRMQVYANSATFASTTVAFCGLHDSDVAAVNQTPGRSMSSTSMKPRPLLSNAPGS